MGGGEEREKGKYWRREIDLRRRMLENDVEYVVLQAKNYILSIVGWRPISYFSPSRDFASTWPCHHHLDSSLYRFNPKAANWLMLLLLVKHNRAFFWQCCWMDLCCDFSKCICCPHISFLKQISPKIFVFYSRNIVNVQNIQNHLFFSIAFMA